MYVKQNAFKVKQELKGMKLFVCRRILNTHFRQKDSKQVLLCYIFVHKLKKFATKEYKRAILASNGNAWYLKMP